MDTLYFSDDRSINTTSQLKSKKYRKSAWYICDATETSLKSVV